MVTIDKKGRGCRGGRSASPAMQIKYRQHWVASFLDWFALGVTAQGEGLIIQLCGVVRTEPALSFNLVKALAQLSEGGPYHPPLRRCHG